MKEGQIEDLNESVSDTYSKILVASDLVVIVDTKTGGFFTQRYTTCVDGNAHIV